MKQARVTIGRGSCGIAAGADAALKVFTDENIDVITVGCAGLCYLEPMVEVFDTARSTYVHVDEAAALEIIKSIKNEPNNAGKYLIKEADKAFLGQNSIVLAKTGIINPEDISEYGGYTALAKAKAMPPEAVIDILKQSGLRGRGGAGFPTWLKWEAARGAASAERIHPLCGGPPHGRHPEKKYIICNADEGDPGAFMDRAILEGDPHAVLEGMLIAAHAVGTGGETEGIVYVRAEYPLAIKRLETAISQAKEAGELGSTAISIKEGAGAFVCGEETALIASIEGERGMPRLKPPFPAVRGLWGRPTIINNVETLANVPRIFDIGAELFSNMGTEKSKGTKVFALTGKIKKGGIAEAAMGTELRQIIYGRGGGIANGRKFKALQLGGPSGGCIPEHLLSTRVCYDELIKTGAMMGSGGMVVLDDSTCMVEMARFFLEFVCKESCGKCVFCRIGTKRMLEILERIVAGKGREGDLSDLETLGEEVKAGSLCQLGATAPNPVLTAIKYFKHEFIDHIEHKKCAALSCAALITYIIDHGKCVGCTDCKRVCPVRAVSGEARGPHTIDRARCIKCGKCAETCKFGAIGTG